jgi:hypothetical protein
VLTLMLSCNVSYAFFLFIFSPPRSQVSASGHFLQHNTRPIRSPFLSSSHLLTRLSTFGLLSFFLFFGGLLSLLF